MNKHLYRIVFNARRGQRMAVAETASTQGKAASGETNAAAGSSNANIRAAILRPLHPLSLTLLCALGSVFTPEAMAQIKADPNAPGNQQPTILNTANGLPQVNIQTPSAAGVSRNVYSQFDVQAKGAILNNSRTDVPTQLGGWVQANPWLAAGSARVILNEVNSANPSQLGGYVEVAGQRAEVVIANPAGIQVNGGGFINASGVTLTTGTPVMNAGNLESYRVRGGSITVGGAGLDTSSADYTNILARAVQANASIWAKDLRVVTGANQINASSPTSTPAQISGTGSTPAFALDVAALGGMYAGKIFLIGTEAGLGVRNGGTLGATAGDVVLQANGWLTNSGEIKAAGNVNLTATGNAPDTGAPHGIGNSGTVYAAGNASLNAAGDISNTGLIAAQGNTSLQTSAVGARISNSAGATLAAGLQANGTLGASDSLVVNTAGTVALQGRVAAAGDATLAGAQLQLADSTLTANNISLTSTNGDIDASRAILATAGTLRTQAAQTLRTDGAAVSAGQLTLGGRALSNVAGDIVQTGIGSTTIALIGNLDNTGGRLASNAQDTTLAAGSLTNTGGKLLLDGNLAAALTGDLQNSGEITANGNASVTTSTLANSGTLQAGATLIVAAANLDNATSGQILATNNQLTASQTLTNRGLIDGQDTRIDTATLRNIGTGRIYGDTLSIAAATLSNEAETLAGVTRAGTIAARQRLDIGAGNLTNDQDALIFSAGNMAIGGSLDANRHATGSAQTITNTGGTIEAAGALSASAAQVSNTNPNFAYAIQSAGSTSGREYFTSSGTYTSANVAWILAENTFGGAGPGGGYAYGGAMGRLLPAGHAYADRKYQPYYNSGNAYVAARIDNTYDVESGYITSTTYTPDSFAYTTSDTIWSVFGVAPPTGANPGPRPTSYVDSFSGMTYFPSQSELDAWDAAAAPWVNLQAQLDTFRNSVNASAITFSGFREFNQDNPVAVVTRTTPGKILSGGAMTLNVSTSLLNDQSQIIAGGTLSITGQAVNNRALAINVNAQRNGRAYAWAHYDHGCGNVKGCDYNYNAYQDSAYTQDIPQTLNLNTARSLAQTSPASPGNTAAPGTAIVQVPSATAGASAIRTVTPNTTQTNSSLFRPTPNPAANYLVETDPLFTNQKNWLGSDYMTQTLGLDPAVTQKRLGDGFYEQRIIREQVAQLTGRRFLDDFTSDEQQYRALMNAGITFAQAHNLRPGIALSATQMATLTADIVWLVEQTVTLSDGTTSRALVPQLYAAVREGDLNGNGALLSGAELNLSADGSLTNSGTILGRKLVQINASTLNNLGGDISAERVALAATQDLNNIGGAISAQSSLSLAAGRDLNVVSTTAEAGNTQGNNSTSWRGIDRVAGLYVGDGTGSSTGTLVASAGRDANLIGAIIQSAGDASVQAASNLNLDTISTASSTSMAGGNATLRQNERAEVGSTVKATGNVSLGAGQDLNVRAASVQAGGNLTATAGNNVNITAGQKNSGYEFGITSSSSGLFSSSTTSTQAQAASATALASRLSGSSVSVSAGNNLISVGSQFQANGSNGTLTVEGKNSQAFYEAVNVQQSQTETKSSSSLLGISLDNKTTSDSSLQTTAVASRLTSTNRIDIRVGDRAVLQGTEVQAGSIAFTRTDPTKAGELVLGSSIETRQTSHTETSETAGVWQEMKGNGSTTQTAKLTTLEGQVSFDPNLKVSVQTGNTNPSAQNLQGQIQALSSQPGLAYLKDLQANPNVKWEQVKLAHEQWSYSQQGLSPAGAALLSIAIAAYTGGMGAELLGGTAATSTSAATLMGSTTLGAAANAGFAALASQAGVALVNNGGDIGKTLAQLGSEQGIKNILTAMATAGALEALSPGRVPTVTGQSGPGAQAVSTAQAANDFLGNLQRNITNNLASSVIDAAINGKPINGSTLTNALGSALVTAGMVKVANEIGSATISQDENPAQLNVFTQNLAHALLGCVASAFTTSGGCAAGAVGGVVGELSAMYAASKGFDFDETLAFAKSMSAMAGVLAGGGGDNVVAVNVASTAGANAAVNNFLFSMNKRELAKVSPICSPTNAVACSRKDQLEVRDKKLDDFQLVYSKDTSRQTMKTMIGEVASLYQSDFAKYGMNAESFLLTMANIESTFNPTVTNSSGYQGLYQFSKDLAMNSYNIGNQDASIRLDPVWSAAAAAQLALDRASELQRKGIPVTPENLYLAHQQGAEGASVLLKNPEISAVEAIALAGKISTSKAEQRLIKNGGDSNMTAKDFSNYWKRKYQSKLLETK